METRTQLKSVIFTTDIFAVYTVCIPFRKDILKMIQFVIKDIKYTMERYMMSSQIHVPLVSNCTGDEKLSDFFG